MSGGEDYPRSFRLAENGITKIHISHGKEYSDNPGSAISRRFRFRITRYGSPGRNGTGAVFAGYG